MRCYSLTIFSRFFCVVNLCSLYVSMTEKSFARNPFLFLIFSFSYLHNFFSFFKFIVFWLIYFLPPGLLLFLFGFLLLLFFVTGRLSLLWSKRREKLIDFLLIGWRLTLCIIDNISKVIFRILCWFFIENQVWEIAFIIQTEISLGMVA